MATKSIYKNVTIKTNAAGLRLAKAIEKSEKHTKTAPVSTQHSVRIVTNTNDILKMFGE